MESRIKDIDTRQSIELFMTISTFVIKIIYKIYLLMWTVTQSVLSVSRSEGNNNSKESWKKWKVFKCKNLKITWSWSLFWNLFNFENILIFFLDTILWYRVHWTRQNNDDNRSCFVILILFDCYYNILPGAPVLDRTSTLYLMLDASYVSVG